MSATAEAVGAPDPTPYLRPGVDLITAADAARWLGEHAEQWRRDAVADPSLGARDVRLDYGGWRALQDAYYTLDARLDRERRQACRRGARRTFADAAELMRGYALEQKCGVVRDTGIEYAIGHSLTRALAFRAAARQP